MTIFYLVRHAHADWIPTEQRPLSPKGQEDAQRVADRLCHFPITKIYSSPFLRALQTILPLAERLGLSVDNEPDLRERKLSDGSSVKDFFAAVKQAWEDPSFAHPGGETNNAAQHRGVAVVKRLAKKHKGELLVLSTHGNLLALVLQYYDSGIDYVFWKALTMPDIYELKLMRGEATITRLWQNQG
jgi:2,3-bisphosphoglycerate-dependent phosphoglycerate mutase